jgi:hypothetical protein
MADSLQQVAELVGRGLQPTITLLTTNSGPQIIVRQLGFLTQDVPPAVATLAASGAALQDALSSLDAARAAFNADLGSQSDVDTAVAEVFAAVVGLAVAVKVVGTTASGLPGFEDLFYEYVLSTAVEVLRPGLASILQFLGIFTQTLQTLPAGNEMVVVRGVRFDRISELFQSPAALFQDVYGWGTNQIDTVTLFENASKLALLLGLKFELEYPTSEALTAFGVTVADDADLPTQLAVPLGTFPDGEISLDVFAVPGPASTDPQGLAFTLEVSAAAQETLVISDRTSITLNAAGNVGTGAGAVWFPGKDPTLVGGVLDGGGAAAGTISVQLTRTGFIDPTTQKPSTQVLATVGSGSMLTADSMGVTATAGASSSGGADIAVGAFLKGGHAVISVGDGDGFITSAFPAQPITANFDLGVTWSRRTGFHFTVGGGLKARIVLNLSLGPLSVEALNLIGVVDGRVGLNVTVDASLELGPVTVSVQSIGAQLALAFERGNLGIFDASAGFVAPTGLGIAIDAGPVSGGGFITFDPANHRYFGALELSIYSVSVKAFGIIETQFPDGHKGFSFLIIISAEFTPIQLGFGFTLLGVGGLAGINRTVDSDGLLAAIKKGDLDNVLFPTDVIDNAPAILHDLETIFPPVDGHFLFGPMAKIGWGTPTLVDGELGLILELPGPRLTVLGTVHAALPTADEAVVELNLDVGGVLDFPKKSFSLDASLHDSRVGDFPVSGDMSMRLTWGQDPNFALSVGGFNPHFNPPASFPKLNPVTVDLGENGNPSINLHGYMALTSNTAQVGALLEARVSKGGADLYGFIGFDALFIFSPFSFTADIEGGVKVNFHGAGFSLHFHGTISGPSPWHLDGQVCVSILWWDACVGFSVTMGGESKPSLPGLDPWAGSAIKADGTQDVPGLQPALQNPANWGGNPPPGSFQVVTLLAPAKESDPPPVDPLGSATVQQKAAPLDVPISAFAGTKPLVSRTFDIKSVTIGQTVAGTPTVAVTVNEPTRVSDLFAPAQFQAMKDADKLSSPSFIPMHGGFTISSSALSFGTAVPTGLSYDQFLLGTNGLSPKLSTTYDPSQDHVTAVTARSATATAGIRGAALARFVDPTALPKVTLIGEGYVLAQISTLKVAAGFSITAPVSRPVTFAALLAAEITSATAVQTLQVTPFFNALP